MSNRQYCTLWAIALFVVGGGLHPLSPGSAAAQGRNARPRRVAHPKWNKDDYARIFFDNIFDDALIGSRPGKFWTATSTGG